MLRRIWLGLAVAGPLFLVLGGCGFDNGPEAAIGPMKDDMITLDLRKAQKASVELDMGVGEMKVHGGGTPKLVDARIEYNVPSWQPEVSDTQTGDTQTVVIKQPNSGHHRGGDVHYNWNVDLNEQVPLGLNLNCGAGKARLDVGNLNLTHVDVHMGAGEVDLDLGGHPSHDYSVEVSGGVGQATVRLPQNVGIRAEAHGGLGSIDVRGLTKHDDFYSNDLLGKSPVTVTVRVNGGVGQIRILD